MTFEIFSQLCFNKSNTLSREWSMGLRDKFEDRIKKKEQEIAEYEQKIMECRAYIQALQDSMRILPRGETNGSEPIRLKHGSLTYKTYELLKKTRRPMHIKEIIEGIGLEFNRKTRSSLRGSLGPYTKVERIFRLVAPGTFGLVEIDYDREETEAEEKGTKVEEKEHEGWDGVEPF
jgi:hypothetical protein